MAKYKERERIVNIRCQRCEIDIPVTTGYIGFRRWIKCSVCMDYIPTESYRKPR